jgi:hypothetical protein
MQNDLNLYTWAINNWAIASLPIGILLLLLGPFIYEGIGFEAFLVFLLLPVYMFHQYEEHAHGEFKIFVNNLVGKGKEVLSDKAIFWINILAVWLVSLVGLYLSVYVSLAAGLAIGYLTVLNGFTHVVMGIIRRSYNPGFWTSLLVFLPLGGFTLYAITRASNAGIIQHVIGLGFAILIHAILIIYIRQQLSNSAV